MSIVSCARGYWAICYGLVGVYWLLCLRLLGNVLWILNLVLVVIR